MKKRFANYLQQSKIRATYGFARCAIGSAWARRHAPIAEFKFAARDKFEKFLLGCNNFMLFNCDYALHRPCML
jgi:hypothetical protein